ncbi:hypothetical protein EV561_12077 [Rhizobium sp. BK376]|nr:hypothetical protein EV561_12077 [Rhizobium sp. BK376]
MSLAFLVGIATVFLSLLGATVVALTWSNEIWLAGTTALWYGVALLMVAGFIRHCVTPVRSR